MRALSLLLLTLCACPTDPDGIYQYTMTGDIQVHLDGYCGSGTINNTAQVQVSGGAATMSAPARSSCTPLPCDNLPCWRQLNFDCTFSGEDVTCTPSRDNSGGPIAGVFALGKCTSSSCSIMSPPIENTYTNVDIEMTRQR